MGKLRIKWKEFWKLKALELVGRELVGLGS